MLEDKVGLLEIVWHYFACLHYSQPMLMELALCALWQIDLVLDSPGNCDAQSLWHRCEQTDQKFLCQVRFKATGGAASLKKPSFAS